MEPKNLNKYLYTYSSQFYIFMKLKFGINTIDIQTI